MRHINSGVAYKQPFQSAYASIRQCLFANAGISIRMLDIALREKGLPGGNLVGRLEALQRCKLNEQNQLATRQCPKCAEQLYHCALFEFPWLIRCPIHGCALTDHCTECGEQWPARDQLTSRSCRMCGIPSVKHCVSGITKAAKVNDYSLISALHQLCRENPNGDVRLMIQDMFDINKDYQHNETRLYSISEKSGYWPSFQAALHRRSLSDLEEANIVQTKRLTVHVSPLTLAPNTRQEGVKYSRRPRVIPDVSIPEWVSKSECDTFNRCIRWIERYAPRSHCTRLRCYRHYGLAHFISFGGACPYCLALSLWLYVVNINRCGDHYQTCRNDFPFLDDLDTRIVHRIGAPWIRWHNKSFVADERFNVWFMSYCLELLFVQCFKVSYALSLWLHQSHRKIERLHHLLRFLRAVQETQCYELLVRKQRLHFYTVVSHPLTRLASSLPRDWADCRVIDQKLERHLQTAPSAFRFCHSLDNAPISTEEYGNLCEMFRHYIASHFYRYTNGSGPFNDVIFARQSSKYHDAFYDL